MREERAQGALSRSEHGGGAEVVAVDRRSHSEYLARLSQNATSLFSYLIIEVGINMDVRGGLVDPKSVQGFGESLTEQFK